MTLLATDPKKRRLELLYLAYAPVWIGIIAYLMIGKAFAAWGDVGHMVLGVGCMLPVVVLPIVLGVESTPYESRYSTRAVVFLVGMSFIQNHLGSWFFFHCLGMQYHFPVTWMARSVPTFLLPLTVAYFSMYYTVMSVGLGVFERRFPSAPRAVRWAVILGLSYAMAFGETFFMDVPILAQYFSYASRSRALWLGSVAYGTLFVCSFPIYYKLDDKTPWRDVAWRLLGCNMLILLAYEVYGLVMGPA